MGHMKWNHLKPYEDWFWDKNRINLKKARVNKINFEDKTLHFSSEEPMNYDQLVLATGSVYNKFGWEGQDLQGVQGLVSKQDLDLLEENTKNCKKAVIIGGGLIGVELAEMLKTRNIEVTFLIREEAFWHNVLPLQDARMISQHVRSHGVDLRHETELDKIVGDENGRVKSILTNSGEEIECQLVGLCAGVRPNINFLKDAALETDRGILVDEYLQTNIKDVYAIGDCVQLKQPSVKRNSIEAVWYTGRMMGETLAQTLTGNAMKYKPGNWFNSAKFFDVEFQTYGKVSPIPGDNEKHFHWQHPDNTKAITVAFEPNSNTFLGINTFGIRMRHRVFDRWLNENRKIDHVLANLKQANFDPEFYTHYEKEIFKSFKENLQEI